MRYKRKLDSIVSGSNSISRIKKPCARARPLSEISLQTFS